MHTSTVTTQSVLWLGVVAYVFSGQTLEYVGAGLLGSLIDWLFGQVAL